jgi:hypothetical protein
MSIAASVTLRLQAIAAGDLTAEPVTHEELVAALRERIGARTAAVRAPAAKPAAKRTPRAKPAAPSADSDLTL